MLLNEQIAAINQAYHPNGEYIPGGVLDEAKYHSLSVKPLLLLKEVNSSEYDWSLPGLFSGMEKGTTPFYRMWKNVSRWALCVQNPDICFQDITLEALRGGLHLFATLNLKKSGGGGSSDYEEILREAVKSKPEWQQEMQVLNPSLVICGGTFHIVKDALDMGDSTKTCGSGAEYFSHDSVLFVEFLHPAYRVSDSLMYAYFKETLRTLNSDGFIR